MTIRPHSNWRSSRVRLHGETEHAARERYCHYLQQSLACIDPTAYFYLAKRLLPPQTDVWALTSDPPSIELHNRAGKPLYLSATQSFRTRWHKGEYKVSTLEYIYNVGERPDARDYMFAWHWHPNQPPVDCHLHVDAELSNGMKLSRKHIPTARISFEEVLRFLIDEFDVQHSNDRWREVLAETQQRHEKRRSWWGGRKP